MWRRLKKSTSPEHLRKIIWRNLHMSVWLWTSHRVSTCCDSNSSAMQSNNHCASAKAYILAGTCLDQWQTAASAIWRKKHEANNKLNTKKHVECMKADCHAWKKEHNLILFFLLIQFLSKTSRLWLWQRSELDRFFFVLFLFGFVLLNIKQCQYVYAIVDGNMKARREHFLCLARVNRIRDDHFHGVKQILVNVRRRRTE